MEHSSSQVIATSHTATATRMPCGITQCYLPPDRGDIPAVTPVKFSCLAIPEGCQAELNSFATKGAVQVCVFFIFLASFLKFLSTHHWQLSLVLGYFSVIFVRYFCGTNLCGIWHLWSISSWTVWIFWKSTCLYCSSIIFIWLLSRVMLAAAKAYDLPSYHVIVSDTPSNNVCTKQWYATGFVCDIIDVFKCSCDVQHLWTICIHCVPKTSTFYFLNNAVKN